MIEKTLNEYCFMSANVICPFNKEAPIANSLYFDEDYWLIMFLLRVVLTEFTAAELINTHTYSNEKFQLNSVKAKPAHISFYND